MFGKHLHRCLEAGVHQFLRERLELGLGAHQALQGDRVDRVVLGRHVARGNSRGGIDNRLKLGRQRGISLGVDEKLQFGAAFPPAGVVVKRRDLVEAELFIVIGPDEFDRVQRSLFQRLIDLAGRHVLRHNAELLHGLAEQAAAETHFQALQVGHGLDFLAVPAAHLGAGIAGAAAFDVVVGVERVEQFAAVAVLHP